MLCSEKELGLPEKIDGIIELGKKYKIGENFRKYIEDEIIFNIGLTPNRGDCSSVRGIARDLSAKFNLKLIDRKINNKKGSFKSRISWDLKKLENKNDCPLIYGRHFIINKNLESPYWLKMKLKSIGLKPISSLVDITNFVLYDIGRPLHVFDVRKLEGDLRVVCLSDEEKFIGLDKKEYQLKKGDIVIKDSKKTVSLAGIMGGYNSCVDENTDEVFLEVAYFCSKKIAQTGSRLGIVSDARYRFERGIDYNGLIEGLEYSTKLILDICGGTFSTYTLSGKTTFPQNRITYNFGLFNKLVGYSLNSRKQVDLLKSLKFDITQKDKNNIYVKPPSWRNDIRLGNDIVEEILRLDGYYNIPEKQIGNQINFTKNIFSNIKDVQFQVRESLARLGLYEVITFSFISEKKVIPVSAINQELKLENPISSELGIMRNSLFPNLLDIASRNFSRGIESTEIFEVGFTYDGVEPSNQNSSFALLLSGSTSKKTWHNPRRNYDFFDMKSIINALFEELLIVGIEYKRSKNDWFHPGISTDLFYKGKLILSFGEIHPNLKSLFKIKQSPIICEGNLENIKLIKPSKKPIVLSPFLPLKKDFAFILNFEDNVQKVIDAIKEVDENIGEITIFDVYKNNQNNNVSIGVEVELIQKDKVLDSQEISFIMSKIIDFVEKKAGSKLRIN